MPAERVPQRRALCRSGPMRRDRVSEPLGNGGNFRKAPGLRVVDVLRNGPVLDAFDDFIHDKQGNKKLLARNDRVAEAVVDGDVQPCRRKQLVK